MSSLWGEEFTVTTTPKQTKKIVDKINKPKKVEIITEKAIKSKSVPIEEKLKLIYSEVDRILGKYKENTICIRDRDILREYFDKAITNGAIAIDTETNNSLDPITCKLMGPCLYTPGMRNAYIPMHHTDLQGNLLDNQLTENDFAEELKRLGDTKIIMHNGKFDYEVIKCTCEIELPIYWDTMIAAKVLDENEKRAGLKYQYIDKIDPSQEKYDIEHLFEGVQYAVVNPEIFALYAATDSFMTYKLYEWQMEQFNQSSNKSLQKVFDEVEMPLVPVLAEMELQGMEVDQDYAARLSLTYHNKLDLIDSKINEELTKLKPTIAEWRKTESANCHPIGKDSNQVKKSKNEQLPDNVNFASATQLSILLYDILKCPQVSTKTPRGTGEEQLEAIYEKTKQPLCKYILERREVVKLLTTYIDVIPELAKRWPDGRVRTHFNQYGAATGRLSSSDPINFQNIPSHEKRIRMLFKAAEGNMIVGADFSAQEPRLTAFYSQDKAMIDAYDANKDLYAVIASKAFNMPYDDCLEFYPEGTKIQVDGKEVICGNKTHQNKAGKERRSFAKSILLGILYGRGAASVGEQIGKSRDEAQKIIDDFYNAFPKVKQWINSSIESAHVKGYVEDVVGRRRRLPDALLNKYVAEDKKVSFNPLLHTTGFKSDPAVAAYLKRCLQAKNRKEYEKIKAEAETHDIKIVDNTGFIAQAERQAVNARVQGGAATLTKKALVDLYYNNRLRELGAKLINCVHDEILIEVAADKAEEAANILTETMVKSAKKYVFNVPMKCDSYIVPCWYLDEFFVQIKDKFKSLEKHLSQLDAFNAIVRENTESTRSQIYEIVRDMMIEKPADYKELDAAIAGNYLI